VIETKSQGSWVIHHERLGALALPTTIQGIVQGRLDRLDPEIRGVLAEAAIVGRTFWQGAVARLWAEEPQGDPAPSLVALLGRLQDRKLTRERIPSTFAGERE